MATKEAGTFDGVRLWQAADGLHVDVRGLSCPQPLVTVLRLIDSGKVDDILIVHLSQEPLLLYPELNERGWRHRVLSTETVDARQDGDTMLEIVRVRP